MYSFYNHAHFAQLDLPLKWVQYRIVARQSYFMLLYLGITDAELSLSVPNSAALVKMTKAMLSHKHCPWRWVWDDRRHIEKGMGACITTMQWCFHQTDLFDAPPTQRSWS